VSTTTSSFLRLLELIGRVTALSLEAFIVRLYREKNSAGFVKAFSDQPEHITYGLSPLRSIMKELQLHSVLIYPRSVF
jgi:DNA excision repair protein ERCC-4